MALEKPGNYTLGRGRLYLARSVEQGPANGFRYVGNTPALDMTVESENLDHFSSDAGVRELDARVTLQVTRSGTFSMDDIQPENLALFVRGSAAAIAQAATAAAASPLRYDIADVTGGQWYQVGQSADNPLGVTDINDVVVGGSTFVPSSGSGGDDYPGRPADGEGGRPAAGGTKYALGDDYEINADMGLIRFKNDGTNFSDKDDVRVYYALAAIANTNAEPRTRVLSGFAAVRGSLMFLENNPAGRSRKYFFPNVEISANGAASLKGDEWRAMPMSFGVLKPPLGGEAVYIDNIPSTATVPTD